MFNIIVLGILKDKKNAIFVKLIKKNRNPFFKKTEQQTRLIQKKTHY